MWGSRSSGLPAHSVSRLRDRRRRSRRRLLVLFVVLLLALFWAIVYGLWQPAVRISSVTVAGGDQALADYAKQAMQGSYLGIIPRDSTFFVPTHRIRVAILSAHPDIAALSISRRWTTGLSIRPSMRTAAGRWCGTAPDVTRFNLNASSTRLNLVTPCYLFDPSGFVYAAARASTTPETLNSFTLYAPLIDDATEALDATIAGAALLPDAFAFARQLASLGSTVESVIIRGDEVDILLASGTRVTYVLGHEQDAYSALLSARASFNLANGSVDYIDLRFPGKVYIKKKE